MVLHDILKYRGGELGVGMSSLTCYLDQQIFEMILLPYVIDSEVSFFQSIKELRVPKSVSGCLPVLLQRNALNLNNPAHPPRVWHCQPPTFALPTINCT